MMARPAPTNVGIMRVVPSGTRVEEEDRCDHGDCQGGDHAESLSREQPLWSCGPPGHHDAEPSIGQ